MMNESSPEKDAARQFSAKQIEKGFYPQSLHIYTDIKGNSIYWRIRLKHPDGSKWIRPMYRDINGDFHLTEPPEFKDKLKPLYGLSLLASHPDALIFIVEGEYPVDYLNHFFEKQNIQNKFIAITSGSATSADAADWKTLCYLA